MMYIIYAGKKMRGYIESSRGFLMRAAVRRKAEETPCAQSVGHPRNRAAADVFTALLMRAGERERE